MIEHTICNWCLWLMWLKKSCFDYSATCPIVCLFKPICLFCIIKIAISPIIWPCYEHMIGFIFCKRYCFTSTYFNYNHPLIQSLSYFIIWISSCWKLKDNITIYKPVLWSINYQFLYSNWIWSRIWVICQRWCCIWSSSKCILCNIKFSLTHRCCESLRKRKPWCWVNRFTSLGFIWDISEIRC